MKNIICIVTVFFISSNSSFASPPDSIELGIELAKIIAPEKNINNKRYAVLLNAKTTCKDATNHFKAPKPYIITICYTNNITIATIQNTKTNKSETYSFTSLDLVNFDL